MQGLVIKGSRNIFTVRACAENNAAGGTSSYECRLKGKTLKCGAAFYNPLAPGDLVNFEEDTHHAGKGMITSVNGRRSVFTRYNRKGELPQILAANIDALICVTTAASPPFRPRFIDRVLAQAEAADLPAFIVVNKSDLLEDSADSAETQACRERLEDFQRIGYRVLSVSALTGEGMAAFRTTFADKRAALIGQSGVGKSSLINALCPAAKLKTGLLNEKYDRGNHTTVQSILHTIEEKDGCSLLQIIDTPGVRQFVPCGISVENLIFALPDFAPFAGACGFGLSCSHESEKDCAILDALTRGAIHPDRYESFLRLKSELAGLS